MSMKDKLSFKEAKYIFIKRSFYCCILALLLCWVMKLFGFDYFELDLDNKFFNDLDLFLNKYRLNEIYNTITLYLQVYFMTCIVQKSSGKKELLYTLAILPFTMIMKILNTKYLDILGNNSFLIEFIFLILVTSKVKLRKIFRGIFITLFISIYQYISLKTRSLNIQAHTYGFVATQILNIDFYLLLYLHKEVSIMGDGTLLFFGLTAWLYYVAGFIVGIFKFHPIRTAKEWYEIGKEKENARKTKRELKKSKK